MTLYGPLTAQNYLRLLRRLAASNPDRRFFEEVLDGLIDTVEAERGFLLRLASDGDFRVLASRNHDRHTVSAARESISHFAIRQAINDPAPYRIFTDTQRDRRYRTEAVARDGSRGAVCILLGMLEPESRQGVLFYLDHRFRKFDFDDHHRTSLDHWVVLLELALRIQEQHLKIGRKAGSGRVKLASQLNSSRSSSHAEMQPVKPVEFHGVWTASRRMSECLDTIRKLGLTEIPVVIFGETGTGKGLVAEAIHKASARAEEPFCSIHCGSIPEALLESELFGHVRGAFTGADRDSEGLVSRARGGTLFLDEIADMSTGMQGKLLRFLESGVFRPLGQKEEIRGDVRIISSTQADLERGIEEGNFRADLYYRLCGMRLVLPSLRERREDISGLAERFLHEYSVEQGVPAPSLDERAGEWILRYGWPGNVRELQNTLRQFVARGLEVIREQDLVSIVSQGWEGASGSGFTLGEVIEKAEQEAITKAMGQSAGNKSRAAEFLGITRKALYRRLVKYGLLERSDQEG